MDKNKCLAKLEEEREHSAFLEMLLRTLYGDDWNKLTISDAQKWNTNGRGDENILEIVE